jgi:hypothetical protein
LTCLFAVVAVTAACGDTDSDQAEPTTSATLEPPTGVPASIGGIIDGEPSGDMHVLGYVVIDQNGSRFCSVLLESFPPQCGQPSVDLVDLDTVVVALREEQGVQWTDDIVVLLGRYRDGTFTVVDVGDAGGAVTSGQCAEDTPDCDDTEVIDDDAGPDTPIPQTSDGGGAVESSSGLTVDGGLSVSEALDSQATGVTGVLAVKGHLYDEGEGTALCETLIGGGERYICGGSLLLVEGLDLELIREAVIIHDGLTYSEEEITVLGEIVDGILVVDPTVG